MSDSNRVVPKGCEHLPFNNLTQAEAERLALIIEEAAEVQQAATKVLRHGYADRSPTNNPPWDNKTQLEKELGDLMVVINLATLAGDVSTGNIYDRSAEKVINLAKYTHHQDESVFGQLAVHMDQQ